MEVVGIRFKEVGKIYYFDPNNYEIKINDPVIVETIRGVEFGYCIKESHMIDEGELSGELKPVIRLADQDDILKNQENIDLAREAFEICKTKIIEHDMEMILVDAEYTFDQNKLLFYFTADGRVDFRDLVKDLAAVFRCRIELRQIGIRDRAKVVGGMGICGRQCCCVSFLNEFSPVSVKMVKDQDISMNPTNTFGSCGRLMCCLNYEHETYKENRKLVPKKGVRVTTPDGEGVVVERKLLEKIVTVNLDTDDVDDKIKQYHVSDIVFEGKPSCQKCDKVQVN